METDEDICLDIESVELLIFSVSGHAFAFDVEDVSELTEIDDAKKKGIKLSYFHERMDLKEAGPKRPKVIIGKRKKEGFIIEEPEDIRLVHVDLIKAVPMIYEKCGKHPSVWGVLLIENRIVLLIDIDEL